MLGVNNVRTYLRYNDNLILYESKRLGCKTHSDLKKFEKIFTLSHKRIRTSLGDIQETLLVFSAHYFLSLTRIKVRIYDIVIEFY